MVPNPGTDVLVEPDEVEFRGGDKLEEADSSLEVVVIGSETIL